MDRNLQIEMTENFVRENLKSYDSGHDWWHIDRVRRLASYINDREALADPFLTDITALLHDTADSKFAGGDTAKGYKLIGEFMDNCEMTGIRDQVIHVIKNISFSNKNSTGGKDDPLFRIIQDADRLDAIGAIGIARAFNYGGFRNNMIYIPGEDSLNHGKTTIGHFYDKLLKLKDLMNTPTGQELALERHKILETFLHQFYDEWYLTR
jgi:uncharacterized protein